MIGCELIHVEPLSDRVPAPHGCSSLAAVPDRVLEAAGGHALGHRLPVGEIVGGGVFGAHGSFAVDSVTVAWQGGRLGLPNLKGS